VSRSSTAAARVAPSPVIAESIIERVPLRLLGRASENVRHIGKADDVGELAEDIAGHGLLQSLIGYYDDDDPEVAQIVGGGRRLQALQLLRDRNQIGGEYLVPVLIRDKAEAIELSLAENLARRQMNPADQFVAFRELMANGRASAADIAKRFGYAERFVAQRMRLAGLHPDILAAVAEQAISVDAAMAYCATIDTDLQMKVFEGQSKSTWKPHDADIVRREIVSKGIQENDPRVLYIGIRAYEKEGGAYEDDLFVEASEHRTLTDVGVVDRLARDKAIASLPTLAKASKVSAMLLSPSLISEGYSGPKKPKPPKGLVWIDAGYTPDETWAKGRALGAEMTGLAFIDAFGKLSLHVSGFFMAKSAVPVAPPIEAGSRYVEMTPEERAASRRAEMVEMWSRRLAMPRFNDDPRYEGRAFWPTDTWRTTQPTEHYSLGAGFFVQVQIFVTEAEASAQVEEAGLRVDEIMQDSLDRAAAAEADKASRAAGREATMAELLAAPPAVVACDGTWFYRWQDESYSNTPEGGDVEPDEGCETLTELLEVSDIIGESFANAADFHAAYPLAAEV